MVGDLETVLFLLVVWKRPAPWVEGVIGAVVFVAKLGEGIFEGDVD